MNSTEIKHAFEEKLGRNYARFITDWLDLKPTELIEKAEEIAATKLMAELLPEAASTDQMEYLLRFSNPLEVVRDKWIEENGSEMVHDDEMSHALWSITDMQDAEQDYTLDPEYAPVSGEDERMTVREFIERLPNAAFDMITPGGYVYLTPEKARLLLSGQSVKAHPGCPDCFKEISAEELLSQEVCEAAFSEGAWHILSNYIREPEQEQTVSDQGVTMC